MDDKISGHGFLPVYTGSDTQHICNGLRRNATYNFRLQSANIEGKSAWSLEVNDTQYIVSIYSTRLTLKQLQVHYKTLPDVPGPPLRPASKGRLHSHSFKVRWDPPADDGGSPITNYILEIDDGRGEMPFHKLLETRKYYLL